MKRIVVIALLLVSSASAAWRDLKEGLEPRAVVELVGQPLMQNNARHGALVTWTYDDGGYILFENGRVRYWLVPHEKTQTPSPAFAARVAHWAVGK